MQIHDQSHELMKFKFSCILSFRFPSGSFETAAATKVKIAKFPGSEIYQVIDFYEQNKTLSQH